MMPMPPAMAPGIRRHSLVAIVSVIRPALAFCFIFILFLDVKYFKDSVPFVFLHHQLVAAIPSTTRI
jgi:hypothetical protein